MLALPTIFCLLLLALTSYAFHLAFGTPPPAVPKHERSKGADLLPSYADFFRFTIQLYGLLTITILSLEMVSLILLSSESKLRTSIPLTQDLSAAMLSTCPPTYSQSNQLPIPIIISCSISIFGSLLRIISRNTLGPFYTWEPSIRPSHKLRTTGPFSFVRHPAYTGNLCITISHTLFFFSQGTVFKDCLGWSYPGLVIGVGVMMGIYTYFGAMSSVKRTIVEDEMLRKEFGKEWDEWAGRVRFRMVPGVF